MLEPQFLTTASGDELVVLERAHYDTLVTAATAEDPDSPSLRSALAVIRMLDQRLIVSPIEADRER